MFRSWLLSIKRPYKQALVAFTDFLLIFLSAIFGCLLSGYTISDLSQELLVRIFWIPLIGIITFEAFGVYRSIIRYIDFSSIYLIVNSSLFIFVALFFLEIVLGIFKLSILPPLNNAGWVIFFLSSITLVSSFRLIANSLFREVYPGTKVLIYGAGHAGIQLAGALRVSSEMEPIAFIDDNKNLHNTYIGGLKILSPARTAKIIGRHKIKEILVAMPSTSKEDLEAALKKIEQYPVKVRILPGLSEVAQGKVLVSELKEVEVTDILGRKEVEPSNDLLNSNIKGKVVLITGAGGSIGSELSRQVARLKPHKLVILDANEYSLYLIKRELDLKDQNCEVYAVLGNVTDESRILEIIKTFKVETIYHAAAYKHVPLVEENPFEGVFNNILGTKTCAEAAINEGVETFVLISTDKAVRPTNIMGATKRFSELILQALATSDHETRMTMVRFGNVIGSSGSAIPLFQQQIKNGGPVTVTHPEVTRYFMSIPEASSLVIQAGAMGKGGDVFVLDMGKPVKIFDLAKRLINLSGMSYKGNHNHEGDIEIVFTGLRPGEKLYEELLIGSNVSKTAHKQILRAKEHSLEIDILNEYLKEIDEAKLKNDVHALKEILKKAVTEFTPEEGVSDILYLNKNS